MSLNVVDLVSRQERMPIQLLLIISQQQDVRIRSLRKCEMLTDQGINDVIWHQDGGIQPVTIEQAYVLILVQERELVVADPVAIEALWLEVHSEVVEGQQHLVGYNILFKIKKKLISFM